MNNSLPAETTIHTTGPGGNVLFDITNHISWLLLIILAGYY